MTKARFIIVNADDFGLSEGTNQGVITAHERGILTSASLMVRHQTAQEAASYAKAHPDFSLGLHFDFGEWVFRNGKWTPLYAVLAHDDADAMVIEAERQLKAFHHFVGHSPTHLDSHQHVHRQEPARSVLLSLAHDLGVPLRHYDERISYCGDFYGQSGKGEPFPEALGVDALLRVLRELPPGITELACHPGLDSDLNSSYGDERLLEVDTLCDPRVRVALDKERISLISFHNLHFSHSESREDLIT
jgi:predicted glycoside hydrolase/deacetylase ChbG (UPF0249 family)